MKYLVSAGTNKEANNYAGSTSLISASWSGHLEVVKYFVSVGADNEANNNNGDNPLIWTSA